jgi:prepilin-type N-terminal cleavage/methylation domain-containing protein
MGRTPERGYSLIEVMVVAGLTAILTAMAVPSVYTLSQEASLMSAQREVMTALYLARANAIATNVPRTVIFTPPQLIQIQDQAHTTIYTRSLGVYGAGIRLTNSSAVSITYDARGLISPPASFTLSLTNRRQKKIRTVTVYPTGKPTAS